jgi:hypothetical protein
MVIDLRRAEEGENGCGLHGDRVIFSRKMIRQVGVRYMKSTVLKAYEAFYCVLAEFLPNLKVSSRDLCWLTRQALVGSVRTTNVDRMHTSQHLEIQH